jgi:hypothetical protein
MNGFSAGAVLICGFGVFPMSLAVRRVSLAALSAALSAVGFGAMVAMGDFFEVAMFTVYQEKPCFEQLFCGNFRVKRGREPP